MKQSPISLTDLIKGSY
ncbi:hypothetical protein Godav_012335 [Gossypium davidsonii]|uniref:Uncharacterized protein n=1 Tax=Gossypium davidsonii TaxID=34287 RepID=A0A7J8RCW7_GOSDV|nr:hypothetical protein [Gossypium davidsonii]